MPVSNLGTIETKKSARHTLMTHSRNGSGELRHSMEQLPKPEKFKDIEKDMMTQIREKNKNMHSTNLMKNTYDRVTPRTNLMSERRSTEVIQSHPGRIIKTD